LRLRHSCLARLNPRRREGKLSDRILRKRDRAIVMIQRSEILAVACAALESEQWVRAAWLGGSDATDRTDRYSDIDLVAVVEDEHVEEALTLVRDKLEELAPIEHALRVPEPAWHGLSQVFWQLHGADPNHFLDFVVMKCSTPAERRLLEPERHGEALVLFDRDGWIVPVEFDREAHHERIAQRLPKLAATFALFQPLVTRAVARGHAADAMGSFLQFTVRPLVELLRIRQCPDRFDFGLRYLDRDLAAEDRAWVERVIFPRDIDELLEFQRAAAERFEREFEALGAEEGA